MPPWLQTNSQSFMSNKTIQWIPDVKFISATMKKNGQKWFLNKIKKNSGTEFWEKQNLGKIFFEKKQFQNFFFKNFFPQILFFPNFFLKKIFLEDFIDFVVQKLFLTKFFWMLLRWIWHPGSIVYLSGNKKRGCGVIFIYRQLSHLFIRAPLHHGINFVPHLAFYKCDKHFCISSLWSQMKG